MKKNYSSSMRGINSDSQYFKEFNQLSKNIRQKIIRLRKEKNLTQEQMEEFELNLRQFQRIESGETKNITLASLFKIAKAFEIKISDLFS